MQKRTTVRGETRCCRNEPGSEFFKTVQENLPQKIPKSSSTDDSDVAEQLPHISCLRSTSRESLLESATATRSEAKRPNGRPRCEYVDMENVYDCHSATRSSSWKRLFGESTFYHKSATTNSETIVRCDKEFGQGSGRNPINIRDQLATKSLEKDDVVN